MITLAQYLSLFYYPSKNSNTFRDFLNTAKVKINNNMEPLKEYMKRKSIDLEDIKLLFENIQIRTEYLTNFYNTSLRIPETGISITEPPMKIRELNNNKLVNYKNVIRNMFHREILKNTKSGINNVPTYWDVLEDLYKNYIIDYKILTPSSIHYMREGRIGSVYSSLYFRASIMNPYLVYSINKSIFNARRVFTPTLGWCSYFYGFAESGITHYVGIDIIPSVCKKTQAFAKKYPNIQTEIICSPSEKVAENKSLVQKYKGKFDLVFFSPPYFKLELYEGKLQSTTQYPDYQIWLQEYWEKTVELCYAVLEKGGHICYILSGYGSENIHEQYDLIGDMNAITKKYFKYKRTIPLLNKNVHVTEHRDTAEKIIIFVKE